MSSFDSTSWQYFQVGKLFEYTRGKRLTEAQRVPGNILYFSASEFNNGQTDRISNPLFVKSNSLIFTTFGDCYFVEQDFTASDEVTILENERMTKNIGIFIATVLSKEKYRFNFGRKAFTNKVIRLEIRLPASNGEPDWGYMEAFIAARTRTYKDAAKPARSSVAPSFNVEEWKYYKLDELFNIKKGKRLVEADFVKGSTPFIGATDSNNGYRDFIGQDAIHEGNTITVSYNGSVGEAYYQPKAFWASDDINVLYPRFKLTPSIALFLTTMIRREKYRFNYGRKWDSDRMKVTSIRLPTYNDHPDWDFMTRYVQSLPFSSQV